MHLVAFERREPRHVSATARAALHEASGGLEGLEEPPALGQRIGAVASPDEVVDLNRALALKFAVEDAGAPEAEADSLLPADPVEFLRSFGEALDQARDALAFLDGLRRRWDGPDLADLGVTESRGEVKVHAPVPRPGKLIGVAGNHPSSGSGEAPPAQPLFFLKASSAVVGPEAEVVLPSCSRCVEPGGALALVIGCEARDVAAAEALDCVAGYTAANDLVARDFPDAGGASFMGRCFDTFAPLGPALVTRDEVGDPQALAVRTRRNGEVVGDASTKEMVFPVAELVAFASRIMTLEPGDVIFSPMSGSADGGTPRWLQDGDVLEVQVERVGLLRSYVRRGS